MKKTVFRITLGVFFFFGFWETGRQFSFAAQDVGIKAGLWEIEQVFEIPGAPAGGFSDKWQYCVKEEDAKQGPVFSDFQGIGAPDEKECRIENLDYPEPGVVTYEIVCGQKEVRIRFEYRFTETSFEGTSRMVSNGRNFTYQMKGRYIGPCEN